MVSPDRYAFLSSESPDRGHLASLIEELSEHPDPALFSLAAKTRDRVYGRRVFFRGLVEISNFCPRGCLYCGISRGIADLQRYRLSPEEIISCCAEGYALGLRSFVLQGGEDAYYTDAMLCDMLREIKSLMPGCSVTLSLGERTRESYRLLKSAGADRYLLRHESATKSHYELLHPEDSSFEGRMACLEALRAEGFQTGAGFMVGSPYQTFENLADELLFLKRFRPHMVGIGPFIPHGETRFAAFPPGSAQLTLVILALCRLMLPECLMPATTALSTIDDRGREHGLDAGANVVMPNISPPGVRALYSIYDGKKSSGLEAGEGIRDLKIRFEAIGYVCDFTRGDSKMTF